MACKVEAIFTSFEVYWLGSVFRSMAAFRFRRLKPSLAAKCCGLAAHAKQSSAQPWRKQLQFPQTQSGR